MTRHLTWGGEYTIQYTDDVLQSRTPETYVILLINVTPVNSVEIEIKKRKQIKQSNDRPIMIVKEAPERGEEETV